ncbi:PAS domain S-box protein [Roseofilum casamattae]|uniref:histidine kinase n=1 Tax=Roseofilum casamattae BLCC-M143 TaxID=3022442 RepID=A0ABT7BZN3_9CYAN|nr:PAS domain S-box protein [Roseofilum casamattae]MDJ1184668.1 PAS domain S-box protein [Roseofilum casamattae BLCC-M143]
MTKKLLTIPVSEAELSAIEAYCAETNRTKTDVLREYIRSIDTRPRENVVKEMIRLKQELQNIQQEKADLEMLLETVTDHSSTIEDDFKNRAKAAKRETEEQFQAITEAMPVAVMISRIGSGEILYANLTASKWFKAAREHFTGRFIADYCINADDCQQLLQQFQERGAVTGYELLCQASDGLPFWVNASLHSLRYKGEETILFALSDIHALKQAKEDLNYAKEKLQAVLDAIPGSVSWLSCQGYYLGVNPHLAEQFGLQVDDFVDRPLGFIQNGKTFSDFITNFIHSSDLSRSEEIQLVVNGEVCHFLVAVQKYDRGNAIVTVGLDVTQRKEAEEALRIAEEKYRSIFENALEGIFQATPDGKFISVNPAMARIYGYDSPEDTIAGINRDNRPVYVNPNDREWFEQTMETEGSVQDWEYQIYRQDGSTIWVSEDTRAVRDGSGQVLYYEGIVQDITKRKQEEENLKRQVAELQIEIDREKRDRQVREITQSSYFQELQAELQTLKFEEEEL